MSLQTILADSCPLVFARNGAETLAAIIKHQPALVLLDVGLPDISGYDLCRKIKQLHRTGFTHEKWDGTGYPGGLKGDEIPKSSRIVALADVFDALSMKRPYKDPWAPEKILDYIQAGAGAHFEPALVKIFSDILPQFLEVQALWSKVDSDQTLHSQLNIDNDVA